MAILHAHHFWWDRDNDASGKPLRSDVRTAVVEVWERVCKQTQSVLGETASVGELMEVTVSQVSAYLDKTGVPLCSRNLTGLLMVTFWRVLNRQAQRLRRLELVGGPSEMSSLAAAGDWAREVETRIDYERIVRSLSDKCRTVLALRDAGYDWKEIAGVMETTETAIKKSFFREIRQLQIKLRTPTRTSKG
jgi:hypothetical protein